MLGRIGGGRWEVGIWSELNYQPCCLPCHGSVPQLAQVTLPDQAFPWPMCAPSVGLQSCLHDSDAVGCPATLISLHSTATNCQKLWFPGDSNTEPTRKKKMGRKLTESPFDMDIGSTYCKRILERGPLILLRRGVRDQSSLTETNCLVGQVAGLGRTQTYLLLADKQFMHAHLRRSFGQGLARLLLL